MDPGKPLSGTHTASIPVRRPVEASVDSPLGGSPVRSFLKPRFNLFQYGGFFRTAKSCTNLETMVPEETGSCSGSTVDLRVDVVDHATMPVSDGRHCELSQHGLAPAAKVPYGGMFRSVKSCANLEMLGDNSAQGDPGAQVNQESGLLFGGLRSYLVKSNMVSAKDLNVFAPLSS